MITVRDVEKYLYSWAPRELAESWDNVGLLCGRKDRPVRRILVALDPFRTVIDEAIELDTDALGYVDPGVTVSIIANGETVEKKKLDLPLELEGVLHCKNPRCITSTEQELAPIFKLTDRTKREYRCIYCESKF